MGTTGALAFVLVERRPGTRVWPFAPLLDKVTSSAQSLAPSGASLNPNGTGTLNPCGSLDHLVGAGEQCLRHVKAERLGGLEIHRQLELFRRLRR